MAFPLRRLRPISRPLPPASTGRKKNARAVGNDDDDLSEDLPPLDGVSGDDDHASLRGTRDDDGASIFDPLDALDEDDPFDDKASEATEADSADDANEAAGSSPERGLLDESDEATTLDIGDADVSFGDESSASLDDAIDPDSDDDESLLDEDETINDAGEEGFDDDEEELREEDLPALDADDDGEVDERSLYEAPESVLDLDPTLLWTKEKGQQNAEVWTMEALAPSAVATFECLAVRGAQRFAAGAELRVTAADGTWRSIALPSPVAKMAAASVTDKHVDVWLVTFEGALLRVDVPEVDAGGGATPTTVESIASWPPNREDSADAGAGAVDVTFAAGALWLLDAQDDLWVSRDGAQTWTREATRVVAMATDEAQEQLLVVAIDRAGALRAIDLARPGARSAVLPFATRATLPGAASLAWGLAVRGTSKLAFAHGAGAWRSIEGGSWTRLPSSSDTFAATWLDDGALLLALGEIDGDREPVRLARATAGGSSSLLTLVAELAAGEEVGSDDQTALALGPAGEGLEGAAIVAGPFGLRILRRGAKPH